MPIRTFFCLLIHLHPKLISALFHKSKIFLYKSYENGPAAPLLTLYFLSRIFFGTKKAFFQRHSALPVFYGYNFLLSREEIFSLLKMTPATKQIISTYSHSIKTIIALKAPYSLPILPILR